MKHLAEGHTAHQRQKQNGNLVGMGPQLLQRTARTLTRMKV